MRTGFIAFVLLVAATVLPSGAFAASKLLMFGDSLTAGYRLQKEQALPSVVERELVAKGKSVTVINGGVSGDTTTGGMRRLQWMLDKHSPDVVFLALGGNDMLRGIAPATVKQNLDTMLKLLQDRGIKTVFMAVKLPPNQDPTYSAQFNAIYPDLAAKYNVPLYPFFLEGLFGNKGYMLDDGVHPNAQGVEYIGKHVADYLISTNWL